MKTGRLGGLLALAILCAPAAVPAHADSTLATTEANVGKGLHETGHAIAKGAHTAGHAIVNGAHAVGHAFQRGAHRVHDAFTGDGHHGAEGGANHVPGPPKLPPRPE
jgi:hypothetical protein